MDDLKIKYDKGENIREVEKFVVSANFLEARLQGLCDSCATLFMIFVKKIGITRDAIADFLFCICKQEDQDKQHGYKYGKVLVTFTRCSTTFES